MKQLKRLAVIGFLLGILGMGLVWELKAEELPKPTYDNTFVLSFVYTLPEPPSSEMGYLKQQFGNGLYVQLCFTDFLTVKMDWNLPLENADAGISEFKTRVNSLIAKAKTYGVGVHLVLNYGGSRDVSVFNTAKTEDIRNAQWYSDNNIASKPLSSDEKWGDEIYTSFSRYARKMRAHLDAAVQAAFAYLKTVREQNPDVLLIISAPGEAELNAGRTNFDRPLQDVFCDYSPFVVLEFRDWITHEGMYGPGGKYENEGFYNGGEKYRGAAGLQNFNNDFGTHFGTWDLKYYDWKLSDPFDTIYIPSYNPDSNSIPLSRYTFDGMMPTTGPNVIADGFDPPRIMEEQGIDIFWDLFRYFREVLVYHYVEDMSQIVRKSGFPRNQYFTHQIPGDYLWGSRPNDSAHPVCERYYTSASPLWTANPFSDIGTGITMYDINYGSWYVRTSQFVVPAIAEMAKNWGIMEYNPEVLPSKNLNEMNTPEGIYAEIKRVYDYGAHFMSFFTWGRDLDIRFKGNNREIAAKNFFDAIKDKARNTGDIMFTPPPVTNLTAAFDLINDGVFLNWNGVIWPGMKYTWNQWGDFKEFVIYRGSTPSFVPGPTNEIGRVTDAQFVDRTFKATGTLYYKVAAINKEMVVGSAGFAGVIIPQGTPIIEVSKTALWFGATESGTTSPARNVNVSNIGGGILEWTILTSESWITCSPLSGVNSGTFSVSVNPSGRSNGSFTGTITVKSKADDIQPVSIQVIMKVYSDGSDAPPFGVLETPEGPNTLSGSIAVTGWALDDIGIESVKIYRKEAGKPIYIGDGFFVEGVRTDVRDVYPTYPGNTNAGWGYMLLTHFLPNNGNGNYEIIAVARDITGHETVIGTKTITCDNNHAVKPFGAIDTPVPGAVISGKEYVNFGWVLTPQPNSIPVDGSTIDVYIDGVKVGNPVYNNPREDIAAFFPGYANSTKAAGYFFIDTTKYSNGLHTISWVVTDSANNTDGIGSRYFYIKN